MSAQARAIPEELVEKIKEYVEPRGYIVTIEGGNLKISGSQVFYVGTYRMLASVEIEFTPDGKVKDVRINGVPVDEIPTLKAQRKEELKTFLSMYLRIDPVLAEEIAMALITYRMLWYTDRASAMARLSELLVRYPQLRLILDPRTGDVYPTLTALRNKLARAVEPWILEYVWNSYIKTFIEEIREVWKEHEEERRGERLA